MRTLARRAGIAVVILLGVAWASGLRDEIHHASTPVQVLVGVIAIPLALVELAWLCLLVARAAKEARDWLWVQRENWRARRQRHERA
jgi:hypothetical protein